MTQRIRLRIGRIGALLAAWLAFSGLGDLAASDTRATHRWAIISADSPASVLGDLLTAELSQWTTVELVERDQIRRVLDELQLNASGLVQAQSAVRFGQLSGADALLMLESPVDQDSPGLRARLVETRSSVRLLDTWLSSKDIEKELPALLDALKQVRGKLAIPDERRRLIGVLAMRSEEPGESLKPLCRTLTALLEADLQRRPDFIVLERGQLKRLTAESDLAGVELQLRSAAWLLETGVRRAEGKAGLVVSGRLVSPVDGSQRKFRLETESCEAGEVRPLLAAAVEETLGIRAQPESVDLTAEATVFAARRERFFHAYRYEEAAEMAEAALALNPTRDNLHGALQVYRIWTHDREGRLRSDEALPPARRLAELRLEWYRKTAGDSALRNVLATVFPFDPHVRLPVRPESDATCRLRAETDALAKEFFDLLYADAASDPPRRLALLMHRLTHAAYLAETGREFGETLPPLIEQIETVFCESGMSRTFDNAQHAAFTRLLVEAVQTSWASTDRSGRGTDEREWERSEVIPLWRKLTAHKDPVVQAAGLSCLMTLPGEDGTQAASRLLAIVQDWPPLPDDRLRLIDRLVRAARSRLGGEESNVAFVEGLLDQAEQQHDLSGLLRHWSTVFFTVVRADRMKKKELGERVLKALEPGPADPDLAKQASGLRQNLAKHLQDVGLRPRAGFSTAEAPGAWQEYVARAIPVRKDPDNFGLAALAVDHRPEARDRGEQLVLVWQRRWSKYAVGRLGLDGGSPRRIGQEFAGTLGPFRGVQVAVDGETVFVASEPSGITMVRPHSTEIFDESRGAPGTDVFHLACFDGWLYVSLRDALTRFDPEKKTFELLASAKALEPHNPFDEGGSYFIYTLAPDAANACLWLDVQDNSLPRSRYGVWQYKPGTGQFRHLHHKPFQRTSIISRDDGGILFCLDGDSPWARYDPASEQLVRLTGYPKASPPPDRPPYISRFVRVGDHIISAYGQLFTPDGNEYRIPTDEPWTLLQRVGPGFITHYDARTNALWYMEPKAVVGPPSNEPLRGESPTVGPMTDRE